MNRSTSRLWRAARLIREVVSSSTRSHLQPVVEQVASQCLPVEPPLTGPELDPLARALGDVGRRLQGVEEALAAIAAELAPITGPFHPGLSMAMVLRRHPRARDVLAQVGLPGCHGCSVRHDETLEEAIEAYAFDGPALLAKLNALLDLEGAADTAHDGRQSGTGVAGS